MVSNKTEEKPVVVSEIVEKQEKEVVLMSEKAAPTFNSDQKNAATSNVSSRVIASPRAKKLASQMGVDLVKIQGSGPHGRIQADDILKANGQPVSIPWIGEGGSPASIPGASLGVESKPEASGNSFGNPGDKVERGESVLVVESDKADMDVESFQDGYLAAVLMPAGSTAPVSYTHLTLPTKRIV